MENVKKLGINTKEMKDTISLLGNKKDSTLLSLVRSEKKRKGNNKTKQMGLLNMTSEFFFLFLGFYWNFTFTELNP